ncbi:MAG: O-methyltransferase [Lachnospiraceae bacterium]|nr:O-methyltransferase [Lachnospiraceae bacterium]
MIVDERYTDFINSLESVLSPELEELYGSSKRDNVPVIRRQTQSLLRFLMSMYQPKSILEVGTAVGFSALFMSGFMRSDGHITTIENYEKRIPQARANFEKFGQSERITLIEGDAAEVLKTLPDQAYDMIFMDAAKGQYIHFLPQVKRVLQNGGLLISDNILQDGQIIESKFALTRRNRTIHKRMREYLRELTHSEDFTTTILTVGDGVALSLYNAQQE